MEPDYNVCWLKTFPHLIFNFIDLKSTISVKFPPLKIFVSLLFTLTALQKNIKWGLHCIFV
jgi:hypothetical protein